jgi:hypothetical protein
VVGTLAHGCEHGGRHGRGAQFGARRRAARACDDSSIAMFWRFGALANRTLFREHLPVPVSAQRGLARRARAHFEPPPCPRPPAAAELPLRAAAQPLQSTASDGRTLCGTCWKRTLAPRHTQQKRVTSCGVRRVRRTNAAPRARPRRPRSEWRKRRKPHARHAGWRRPSAAEDGGRCAAGLGQRQTACRHAKAQGARAPVQGADRIQSFRGHYFRAI